VAPVPWFGRGGAGGRDGGRRVRRGSGGWPVDERTQGAIGQLRERDWDTGLHADGSPDPNADVAELTGILRHGPAGDQMSGWLEDVRVIARRVPRPAAEQAKLGEDADCPAARSPPTPRPGRSNGSTPGTAPRPTSRTRSKS